MARMFRVKVSGTRIASNVVHTLAQESAYFEYTPLPDDVYEIAVKEDREATLREIVAYFTALLEQPGRLYATD